MALPYSSLDDIKPQQVSLNGINQFSRKLIENDKSMDSGRDQQLPIIWECLWYNDDNIVGYPVGTKVWLNTEDPQEFLNNNRETIEEYVLNSNLRNDYERIRDLGGNVDEYLLSVI
jgi:hypothetical protein